MIETLARGIEGINQRYIESPDLSLDQYRALVAEYLVNELLSILGHNTPDLKGFSFYSDPAIGYTGYIKAGEQVLFFAPTKTIIMDKALEGDEGELSPYGTI